MDTFTFHGGRRLSAMRAWPHAPRCWIDLATGIKPGPYPAARDRLPYSEEISAVETVLERSLDISALSRIAGL
jgi:hypothetical protein